MKYPSRVIVVNDFACINGGQAKVAIQSARMLAQSGVDVTFFAACGPVDSALNHKRIKTICLGQNDILSEPNRVRAALRGIWNSTAKRQLGDLCSNFESQSTVLHCHGFAKALSPSIGKILGSIQTPSVYTMHEYFLACPNGGFFDFRRNEICNRHALGFSCLTTNCDVRNGAHKVWRVARQITARSLGNLPSGLRDIIYISETQRVAMQGYLPKAAILHYVPNPIDVAGVSISASENEIFLFVGRLSPEKGGRLFAEAARLRNVKAVFVGDGPERAAIETANPDAIVTGWLSTSGVQAWLAKARCLVFPSLWYECQPLVPMEALAMGVPVITGSWNAAAEEVKDGITGLHISEPSVECLANAIGALMDPEHQVYCHIGKIAPRVFEEGKHLNLLLEVYSKVLERSRGT